MKENTREIECYQQIYVRVSITMTNTHVAVNVICSIRGQKLIDHVMSAWIVSKLYHIITLRCEKQVGESSIFKVIMIRGTIKQ